MLPEEVRLAARDYDPSRINRYLVELSGDFHRFYNACRIREEAPALRMPASSWRIPPGRHRRRTGTAGGERPEKM